MILPTSLTWGKLRLQARESLKLVDETPEIKDMPGPDLEL